MAKGDCRKPNPMKDFRKSGPPLSALETAILTAEEMRKAEVRAFEGGLDSYEVMQKAGWAVAAAILKSKRKGRALILCGPGNNGGDGWVAAKALKEKGWRVACCTLADPGKYKGDARRAFEAAGIEPVSIPENPGRFDVIVDALFGTGLARPLEGKAAEWVNKAGAAEALKVAVDMPSGISSDTGQVLGAAFTADLTVTFFRKKRGHMLNPGMEHCGEVRVAQIGFTETHLKGLDIKVFENAPALWLKEFPRPAAETYKHKRGHVAVFGGKAEMSGAARMAAYAALRTGAGLVTTLVPKAAVEVYAKQQLAVMTRGFASLEDVKKAFGAGRFTAIVIGPGNGVGKGTQKRVLATLETGLPAVLDADALTSFEKAPEKLFKALHENAVLTPHAGEFRRLFPKLDPEKDKIKAAQTAAKEAGCIVLLKGAATVIAAPGEAAIVNVHASPYLATAGAGDVLSGIIAGLLAQGMPPWCAAAAAAWLHGEVSLKAGPGLIAEDLIKRLPAALKKLALSK